MTADRVRRLVPNTVQVFPEPGGVVLIQGCVRRSVQFTDVDDMLTDEALFASVFRPMVHSMQFARRR